jgi:hypothetical protein
MIKFWRSAWMKNSTFVNWEKYGHFNWRYLRLIDTVVNESINSSLKDEKSNEHIL